MLKILLLSLSRQYTVDGQYIPSLFIEPEVRHDKTSYTSLELPACLRSYSIVAWCLQGLRRRWTSPLNLTCFNLYEEPSFTHVYIV